MKWWLFCALLLLSLQTVSASQIEVDVSGLTDITVNRANIEERGSLASLHAGVHNTGSNSYAARARMDIMGPNGIMFTGWSSEKAMAPGERKSFRVYGYVPPADNLSARIRIYYGNEIEEVGTVKLNRAPAGGKDAFSIGNFRAYECYVRFELKSNRSVDDVVVMPHGLPGTWIFEQERIEHLEKDRPMEVIIPYRTGFFQERSISILVAAEGGEYLSDRELVLKREKGLLKYLHMIMDFLSGLLM